MKAAALCPLGLEVSRQFAMPRDSAWLLCDHLSKRTNTLHTRPILFPVVGAPVSHVKGLMEKFYNCQVHALQMHPRGPKNGGSCFISALQSSARYTINFHLFSVSSVDSLHKGDSFVFLRCFVPSDHKIPSTP